MKFSVLNKIIKEYAFQLKEDAGYSGSYTDGGCQSVLNRLRDYKDALIVKHDLRPSEYSNLDSLEVGEPLEFKEIITKYKIELAKNIIL